MKRIQFLILFLLSLTINSCKKENNAETNLFPGWLQIKITELISNNNLCEISDVTIIDYKGKKYYHLYSGIWSCMYCQFFDENGNSPNWETTEWEDFHANQKILKKVSACQ